MIKAVFDLLISVLESHFGASAPIAALVAIEPILENILAQPIEALDDSVREHLQAEIDDALRAAGLIG